jgi:hypothetical protein
VNTTPEYVPYLLSAQAAAGKQVGVNVYGIDHQTYVVNLSVLTLIGMVIKALNDHGVVLDAEWQTRLNAAYQGPWPANLINQVDPNKPVDPGATG